MKYYAASISLTFEDDSVSPLCPPLVFQLHPLALTVQYLYSPIMNVFDDLSEILSIAWTSKSNKL